MIEINNVFWSVKLVPANYYILQKDNGSFAVGACDYPTRTIYINENVYGAFFKKVLAHELTHAAMFSYNVNLTVEEEELLADIIATYGEEIISITNTIFIKLRERYI